MDSEPKEPAVVVRSWKTLFAALFILILLNWLVGGTGFLVYQSFQTAASESKEAVSEQLNDGEEDGKYWADRIVSGEGAFILYLRHAEREKWPLVATYDYFEVANSVDGSQENFAAAVCLSEKGKEDAKLIGRAFDVAGLSVTKVLASPSCRARETANLAFGRIDVVNRAVMSAAAVGISQDSDLYAGNLGRLLVENFPADGQRVAVVGHAQTLEVYAPTLFPGFDRTIPKVNESGFYVIEVVDGNLVPRWAFIDFYDFAREVLVY